MSLGQSGKNGPKTQFRLKLAFVLLNQKIKSDFLTKKSLSLFWPCQKMPYLAQMNSAMDPTGKNLRKTNTVHCVAGLIQLFVLIFGN